MKVKISIATAIGIIFAEVVEGASTAAALLAYLQRADVAEQLAKLLHAPWCFQAECFDALPDKRPQGEGSAQADVALWQKIEAERQGANAEPWRDEIPV